MEAAPDLVRRFVTSFQRAIGLEMDAMRERLGPYEVSLRNGRLVTSQPAQDAFRYEFEIVTPNDKLVVGMECYFACGQVEQLVGVIELGRTTLCLRSERRLPVDGECRLVIYPWFLYDKLRQMLETVETSTAAYNTSSSLRLFGKLLPVMRPARCLFDHENLNPSQRRAVELCSRSNVAFVWGPPGTGKTTTLSHIVLELLSKRQRILIAATTNAALDRALSHLVRQTEIRQLVDAGGIVRVGNSEAETFGTALYEVRQRVGERQERALARARHRERDRRTRLGACANLLELLAMSENRQQNLFGEKPEELPYFDWLAIDRGAERRWRRLKHAAKVRASTRRRDRLTKLCRLYADRTRRLTAGLERVEAGIVRDARVILSTLTNTYFSTLLAAERFDVLIVEEAGMAILPNLFYAASLAHGATIMVGDPKQLPAIVQSKDPYVRRAMGRNIFDVAISDPHSSEIVAMLTTQYRMHPLIGTLVSTSFYDGRVENGPVPDHVLQMAGREPFPGTALVVVDTSGHSNAESAAGGSRCNENAAELAAVLAVRARKQCAGRIAVITPYAAQSRKIRQLLRARQEPSIECSTVHRFQGHECDVVILDTTDAEPLRPGVLLTETGKGAAARHLINVSISRARAKLVIIADVQYFRTRAPDAPITNVLCVAGKLGHTVRFEDVN